MARYRSNSRVYGITVEIGGDTTKLQKALDGVTKEISSAQNQLRDVNKLLKMDPGNTELLSQKHRLLGEAVSATKKKLEALKQANEQVSKTAGNYDAWKEKYEPIKKKITETKELLESLKKKDAEATKQFDEGKISQEKYDALKAKLKETEKHLKGLNQEAKAVDEEFGNPISPEKYDALQREIIETAEDLKKLEKQAAQSGEAVQAIAAKGEKLKEMGAKVTDAGEAMLPVTAAVTGLGAAAVKTTADFDTAMSQVAASMGKTVDEIPKIREEAKRLGETTAFSAVQVAEGFNILAQAGLKEEEQLAAIGPVLDLAAAGHIDLAAAASYVTGTVMGFGDEMGNAAAYADKIAAGATVAKTDVNQLGEAFSGASSSAKSYGQSTDTTMVSLLRLAQANVTGSEATTMLNRVMSDLYTPTDKAKIALDELGVSAYDQYDKARDLTEVMADLQAATAGMSDKQRNAYLNTIFTTNGLKGYSKMTATSAEKTAEFYEVMAGSGGAAARQAAVQLDNLTGDIIIFKSAAEGLLISYGETIEPIVRQIVQGATQLANWLNSLDDGTKKIIVVIAAVVAAIGPLLIIIGTLMSAIGSIMTWAPIISGAIATLTGTLLPALSGGLSGLFALLVSNPIGIIIVAIGALVVAVVYLWKTNEVFRDTVLACWERVKEAFSKLADAVLNLLGALGLHFNGFAELVSAIWDSLCQFLAPVLSVALQLVSGVLERALTLLTDILNIFAALFRGDWEGFWNGIAKFVTDVWNMLVNSAYGWGADLVTSFINGIKSMLNSLWKTVKSMAQGVRDYIGFSEPRLGPLSNFHTYAPDMMRLFAQGIRDSEPLVRGQLEQSLPEITVNAPQTQTVMAAAGQAVPRNQTIIMQVDRTQFARLVYQLNADETRRMGVKLTT